MFTPYVLHKGSLSFTDIAIEHTTHSSFCIDEATNARVSDVRQTLQLRRKEEWRLCFNGNYYRVETIQQQSPQQLAIGLSTIRYQYIAAYRSMQDFFESSPEHHLNHLSVAAMIKTSDNKYVFGVRSHNGSIDLIGGGVQKDELLVQSGTDIQKTLYKECKEEIWLDSCHISSCTYVGTLFSYTSNNIVIASMQLAISSQELSELFHQKTDEEMKWLLYIEPQDIQHFLGKMKSYRPLINDIRTP